MIRLVNNEIKVLLIESCDLVRIGLRALFENHPFIKLSADTNNMQDLMYLAKQHQPDIVIIDHLLLFNDRAHHLNNLKQLSNQSKVLVLTEQDNPLWRLQILQMRLAGFISKSSSCKLLLSAITAIHTGEIWLNRSTLSIGNAPSRPYRSTTFPDTGGKAIHSKLSRAESLIASLACRGLSAKEIGLQLSIEEKSVRNQLSAVYRKIGVRKQIELCIKAPLHNYFQ